MGIYFFCYEWVLSKLTIEGERFVKFRCLLVSIQFKSLFNIGTIDDVILLLHVKKDTLSLSHKGFLLSRLIPFLFLFLIFITLVPSVVVPFELVSCSQHAQ